MSTEKRNLPGKQVQVIEITGSLLGEAYYKEGNKFFKENRFKEALEYFEKSAQQEYPAAYVRLWQLYEWDFGIPKNKEKQAFWIKEIAKAKNSQWLHEEVMKGDVDGQFNLAACYYNGVGVVQDLVRGVKCYQLAADQGHAAAQWALGSGYQEGKGVTKDLDQAVKYYRLAAEQGYPSAQINLGWCYQQGEGVAKDLTQAVKYYQLSAIQENPIAQFNLGKCYENGEGVPKDLGQAAKYYGLAATQGYERAESNLARLEQVQLEESIKLGFHSGEVTTTSIIPVAVMPSSSVASYNSPISQPIPNGGENQSEDSSHKRALSQEGEERQVKKRRITVSEKVTPAYNH